MELLPVILPPLYDALNFAAMPFEVIISDDCSKDDSVNFIRNRFPQVQLIVSAENKGFSPTINKGIFAAKYDYVLLLNSDVILTQNYFAPLLRYFEKEDTFGVTGRIIGWNDDELQDSAKFPSFHGAKIKTAGNYFVDEPKTNDWLYSMYLSGANALVDRKKLLQLNGFDEIFAPFYVEDFELSLRAWRMGWKCYYEHFAVCRHKISVSIKSKSNLQFVNTIYYRNKMFLHAMHLPAAAYYFWYLQNVFEIIFQTVIGKTYYLKGFLLFLKNSTNWKNSRTRFLKLTRNSGLNISVRDVRDTITQSLSKRVIRKF